MGEFGDRLRRERELRGITLQEISESTKISKKSLEALEKEEFEALPGGVFNRGFVRSYAKYVGLNPDEAIADYLTAAQERSEQQEDRFPLEVPENREKKGSPALNPRGSFWSITLAVLGLIAVLIYWTIRTRHATAHPQAVKPSALVQPQSSGPGVPGASGVSAPQIVNPAAVSADSPNGTGAAGRSLGAASDRASSELKDASRLPQTPAGKAPAARSHSYTVAVTARSDSWVSIVADGKTIMEGVLDANQNRSVKFEKEMVLKTGNAGGLDVRYNGKPLGALGADNQVRTLRFPLRAPAQ
jgi:cytoskeleton protein RodZ